MKTNKNYVYKFMPTVLGKLKLIASDSGLAAILWENDKPTRVRLGTLTEDKNHPILLQAERELAQYLDGERKTFSVKLDPAGTPFKAKCGKRWKKFHLAKRAVTAPSRNKLAMRKPCAPWAPPLAGTRFR